MLKLNIHSLSTSYYARWCLRGSYAVLAGLLLYPWVVLLLNGGLNAWAVAGCVFIIVALLLVWLHAEQVARLRPRCVGFKQLHERTGYVHVMPPYGSVLQVYCHMVSVHVIGPCSLVRLRFDDTVEYALNKQRRALLAHAAKKSDLPWPLQGKIKPIVQLHRHMGANKLGCFWLVVWQDQVPEHTWQQLMVYERLHRLG